MANGTKPSSSSQGLDPKSEHGNASHIDVQGNKTKTKDHKRKWKLEEENTTNGDPTTTETATVKRTRRTRRKRSSAFGDPRTPPLPDAESLKQERRNGPVWFSLVASNNQWEILALYLSFLLTSVQKFSYLFISMTWWYLDKASWFQGRRNITASDSSKLLENKVFFLLILSRVFSFVGRYLIT